MMPPVLHSTKDFNWFPKHNCFIADASDFHAREPFNRAHGDTPGFELVSEKTGRKVLCLFHAKDGDEEGDVQGWRFRPRMEYFGGKWRPLVATWEVLIVND